MPKYTIKYQQFKRVLELRNAHGKDGKRITTVPTHEVSKLTDVDTATISKFMKRHGYWVCDKCARPQFPHEEECAKCVPKTCEVV